MQQHLGDGMTANKKSRFKVVRAASAIITLASVGVLSLVVAESGGTVHKHTVVTRHVVHSKEIVALPSRPASSSTPAAQSTSSSAPVADTTPANGAPVVTAAATKAPTTAPTSTTPPSTTTGTTLPAVSAKALPACPLGLSSPTNPGGLQSLIGFAPVFGPFSAEAFASAAAFQPVLELIGPFLVAFANEYEPYSTQVAPLLKTIESLENLGYTTLLEPLTAPYQTQLLTAETQLATALAPGATALLDNPASSCVVDIEGLLTGDS